jgi:hypothetical protein
MFILPSVCLLWLVYQKARIQMTASSGKVNINTFYEIKMWGNVGN